jgi:hypothetical protein
MARRRRGPGACAVRGRGGRRCLFGRRFRRGSGRRCGSAGGGGHREVPARREWRVRAPRRVEEGLLPARAARSAPPPRRTHRTRISRFPPYTPDATPGAHLSPALAEGDAHLARGVDHRVLGRDCGTRGGPEKHGLGAKVARANPRGLPAERHAHRNLPRRTSRVVRRARRRRRPPAVGGMRGSAGMGRDVRPVCIGRISV